MKGEWRSAPREGVHRPLLQDDGMSFNSRPARISPEGTRAGLTADSRHCALSSAHGAKHCADAQHGGNGYGATIVVAGPQDRSDKGRLVSASPWGAPCVSTPSPPYRGPFGSSFA